MKGLLRKNKNDQWEVKYGRWTFPLNPAHYYNLIESEVNFEIAPQENDIIIYAIILGIGRNPSLSMKGILKYKTGWVIEYTDPKAIELADKAILNGSFDDAEELLKEYKHDYVLTSTDVLFEVTKLIESKEVYFKLDEAGVAHISDAEGYFHHTSKSIFPDRPAIEFAIECLQNCCNEFAAVPMDIHEKINELKNKLNEDTATSEPK